MKAHSMFRSRTRTVAVKYVDTASGSKRIALTLAGEATRNLPRRVLESGQ